MITYGTSLCCVQIIGHAFVIMHGLVEKICEKFEQLLYTCCILYKLWISGVCIVHKCRRFIRVPNNPAVACCQRVPGFFQCMFSALRISHFSFICSDKQVLPQAFLWVCTRLCDLYAAVSKRVSSCRSAFLHAVRVDQLVSVQRDMRDGHEIQRALR